MAKLSYKPYDFTTQGWGTTKGFFSNSKGIFIFLALTDYLGEKGITWQTDTKYWKLTFEVKNPDEMNKSNIPARIACQIRVSDENKKDEKSPHQVHVDFSFKGGNRMLFNQFVNLLISEHMYAFSE